MNKQQEQGWIAGAAWAAGFMAASHNEGFLAWEIVLHSGLTKKQFEKAAQFDLDQMREGVELKEFLGRIKGCDAADERRQSSVEPIDTSPEYVEEAANIKHDQIPQSAGSED